MHLYISAYLGCVWSATYRKKRRNKLKEKSSNITGLPFEWRLPVLLQPYSKFCLCKIQVFILTPVALDSSVLYWSFRSLFSYLAILGTFSCIQNLRNLKFLLQNPVSKGAYLALNPICKSLYCRVIVFLSPKYAILS